MRKKEFEELFKRYKDDIYRIAYVYMNNQADALDIVQETAYQAYISRNKIRDKDKFKSWILMIAVNKSKDFLRKKKPILVEDLTFLENKPTEREENLTLFIDNLKSLSLEEKNIIILKIYFEYTFEMISERLEIPINTIKSKYYRALDKLRLGRDLCEE